jgi:hypothetical protein
MRGIGTKLGIFIFQVVGRQKELSGYVRRGCKDGWVEIELKGKPGGRNKVVRRELTAANNSSKFFLDGKSSWLLLICALD